MNNKHPEAETGTVFTPNEVRQWIARARSYRPVVPKEVSDYMVGAYVRMRQQQKRDESNKKAFTHTSPRTLLGVLRLSQALARLRFADSVISEDVDEALRLTEVSKASLYGDERARGDQTPSSKIYHLVRGMKDAASATVADGSGELDLRRVRERVLAKGFTEDQFQEAVEEYALIDVSLVKSVFCGFMLTVIARCGKLLLKELVSYSSRREKMTMRMMSEAGEQCDGFSKAGVCLNYGDYRQCEHVVCYLVWHLPLTSLCFISCPQGRLYLCRSLCANCP
jgi:hypothetical protein